MLLLLWLLLLLPIVLLPILLLPIVGRLGVLLLLFVLCVSEWYYIYYCLSLFLFSLISHSWYQFAHVVSVLFICFFFFFRRRRHTRCSQVSWARGCVYERGVRPLSLSLYRTLSLSLSLFLPSLLYTSHAADDLPCVDLGGRRIIKKKTHLNLTSTHNNNV